MSRKKESVWKKVFKGIGIALAIGLVVGVICYFAVPEFQTFINDSWQDLKNQIENNKETVDEAVEAAKHLVIR